ncbi:MAG: PadR family transcriptional regulator [Chloroflexota bacterium]|nr:MAG: hypothetical protein DLM70_04220 [Chloroflexota bacterium]
MYEFMVLSTLAKVSMHGYKIAKVLGYIMGPYKHVQWGALYPVLSRLEADGLIHADIGADEDGSTRKSYSVTEAGCTRLHQLLMDTERHLGDYDSLFPHKVTLFWFLRPDERLYLSRHYAVYAQQNIEHLTRRLTDLEINRSPLLAEEHAAYIIKVMTHKIDYWDRERAWAETLIERASSDSKPLAATKEAV